MAWRFVLKASIDGLSEGMGLLCFVLKYWHVSCKMCTRCDDDWRILRVLTALVEV